MGQARIWFTLGQKLGHIVQILKNLINCLEATVLIKISFKLVRKNFLMISRLSLNIVHLESKNITQAKYRKAFLTPYGLLFQSKYT